VTDTLTFAVSIPIGAWRPSIVQTFASLKAQTVSLNIALLDASGDQRIAEAAEASGLIFTYRRHGPDRSQSAAIDEGWREIPGDVLFWLNDDDQLQPGALEQVQTLLQADAEIDAVYAHSDFVNGKDQPHGSHDQVEAVSDLLYRSNIISQPSCFVRRAAIEAVGGLNPDLHYVMDWDLWVRLYADGARFHYMPKILSRVCMGERTKTGGITFRRLWEVFTLVNTHAGPWSACKSTLALAAHTLNERRRYA